MQMRPLLPSLLFASLFVLRPDPALAGGVPRAMPLSLDRPAEGRPTVVLDRLTFPANLQGAATFEKQLRRALRVEAARADWGAGRDNRIEYRFEVRELRFTIQKDALLVYCAATGKLPGGQTAHSELSFGGGLAERTALINRVLSIVARGVITRLSELERKRRGLL